MAWQDIIDDLRDELADARSRRLKRAEADEAELNKIRQEMTELSDTLGIRSLLAEINATLLEGRGEIETIVSWEQENGDSDSESDSDGGIDSDNEEDDEEAIEPPILGRGWRAGDSG